MLSKLKKLLQTFKTSLKNLLWKIFLYIYIRWLKKPTTFCTLKAAGYQLSSIFLPVFCLHFLRLLFVQYSNRYTQVHIEIYIYIWVYISLNVCAAICVCVAAMHIYQVYIEEAGAEAVAGCHYVRRKDGAVAGKVEKWGSGGGSGWLGERKTRQ